MLHVRNGAATVDGAPQFDVEYNRQRSANSRHAGTQYYLSQEMESRLFPSEFLLILAWVLFPALFIGLLVLVAYHVRTGNPSVLQTVQAGTMLTLLSFVLLIVFTVNGPAYLSPWLGLRDHPVMWAPFAFAAVFFALPLSIWWMRLGITAENKRQQ